MRIPALFLNCKFFCMLIRTRELEELRVRSDTCEASLNDEKRLRQSLAQALELAKADKSEMTRANECLETKLEAEKKKCLELETDRAEERKRKNEMEIVIESLREQVWNGSMDCLTDCQLAKLQEAMATRVEELESDQRALKIELEKTLKKAEGLEEEKREMGERVAALQLERNLVAAKFESLEASLTALEVVELPFFFFLWRQQCTSIFPHTQTHAPRHTLFAFEPEWNGGVHGQAAEGAGAMEGEKQQVGQRLEGFGDRLALVADWKSNWLRRCGTRRRRRSGTRRRSPCSKRRGQRQWDCSPRCWRRRRSRRNCG